jgi:cytochrome P450
LIREIFGNDPANYDPFATGALVPILGEGSMLTMGGETHRRERKLVMPMFHGDRMRAYGSAMQEVALEKVNQYLDRGLPRPGCIPSRTIPRTELFAV